MIRDNEITRLIKYAESLNIKVLFKVHKKNSPGAEWIINENGRQIIIYTWKKQSKTDIILNLIHELAHEKSFIKNNRTLNEQDTLVASLPDEELSKAQRKIVYNFEKKDSEYREEIYHELDLKFPKWKLTVDIELDIWVYFYFYKNGKYPKRKDVRTKYNELKKRYK